MTNSHIKKCNSKAGKIVKLLLFHNFKNAQFAHVQRKYIVFGDVRYNFRKLTKYWTWLCFFCDNAMLILMCTFFNDSSKLRILKYNFLCILCFTVRLHTITQIKESTGDMQISSRTPRVGSTLIRLSVMSESYNMTTVAEITTSWTLCIDGQEHLLCTQERTMC